MTFNDLRREFAEWKITRHRILHFTIGVFALMLLEFVARPYYRPFIYSHSIYDFHVADTLGNSLGTMAAVFIIVGLLGRDRARDHFLIKTTTISMAVYELAHPLLGKPIDPWDILATILTGGLCVLLYTIIHQNKTQPVRSIK